MKRILNILHRAMSGRDAKPGTSLSNQGAVPPQAIDQPSPADPPVREQLQAIVDSHDYWYQRIHLGRGVYTVQHPGYHESVWSAFERIVPKDLGGASVLDVGCNAGYFSIQMKLRGAGKVVGIEPFEGYWQQAMKVEQVWKLGIEYLKLDAHELDQITERSDIVVFCGILYHLRNPLLVLEHVARLCRDALLVESEDIPDDPINRVLVRQGPTDAELRLTPVDRGLMRFVEGWEMGGDGSNWWIPDTECVLAMLRTVGFTHFSKVRYHGRHRLLLLASKREQSLLDLAAF
jgi:tRNA (mo5U34)-methyltransferase